MTELKIRSPFGAGEEDSVSLRVSRYADRGRVYLGLCSLDREYGCWEPYADITVNLPGEDLTGPECGFVDTNNMPGIETFLSKYGLGFPTGRTGRSGYCEYPEYRFDLEKAYSVCLTEQESE